VSATFRKMEKEQYRSVIRFLFLEGKSRSEIKERLDAVYGDSSPSMATIKNWFNEFQRGRTSVFDSTEDNVTKVHDLVLADCRLKIREIVETVGMSKDRVGHTLSALATLSLILEGQLPPLLINFSLLLKV